MDSDTGTDYKNGRLPNLTPIDATDLHLCCGDEINSAFEGLSPDIPLTPTNYKADYCTSGAAQCQLVSGAQSPILPVQVTWECPDQPCSEESEVPANYPVRVFCAA
eukprot:73506_1